MSTSTEDIYLPVCVLLLASCRRVVVAEGTRTALRQGNVVTAKAGAHNLDEPEPHADYVFDPNTCRAQFHKT